jgi:hypothetical protein
VLLAGAFRQTSTAARPNFLFDLSTNYYFSPGTPSVYASSSAVGFSSCLARGYHLPNFYFTGLPGRAGSVISGDNISGG